MIENSGFPLAAVIAGLIIFIFVWIKFFPPEADQPLAEKSERTGPALIVLGAILNLMDRIPDGKVNDFINLGIATLNLADLAIYLGIIYVAKSLFSGSSRSLG